MYADDLLLMARGDVSSVTTLMAYLMQFAHMAGLTVNITKFSIYMIGIEARTKDRLLTITGF